MCGEIRFGYFDPCTNTSRREPEVVVMFMVKRAEFMLGGILCMEMNCVKGKIKIEDCPLTDFLFCL